jgi:predicted O-methyltransferase YrrM
MKVTLGMVGRQTRYLARSARDVAREPSLARDLPRLLRTRGKSTVTLRYPWLPFRLIDELADVIGPGTKVFEYGGGGSTLWFLDRGAEVVTVEHHREWAARLATRAAAERWTLLERSSADGFAEYVNAIADFPKDAFDVVVVDGRERGRCARAAMDHVRPGGWLIVDDVDRERYASALRTIPWTRRDVTGFAPAKPSLAYSAVFVRPRGLD